MSVFVDDDTRSVMARALDDAGEAEFVVGVVRDALKTDRTAGGALGRRLLGEALSQAQAVPSSGRCRCSSAGATSAVAASRTTTRRGWALGAARRPQLTRTQPGPVRGGASVRWADVHPLRHRPDTPRGRAAMEMNHRIQSIPGADERL